MQGDTIEALMGKSQKEADREMVATNRLNHMLYLDENSFEFSLADLAQTEGTCDFALIGCGHLSCRHRFLINTLERDKVAFEVLNGRRGQMRADSGVDADRARALERDIRDRCDYVVDEDCEIATTPTVLRVHLAFDDMLDTYKRAISCDSPRLERYAAKAERAHEARIADAEH